MSTTKERREPPEYAIEAARKLLDPIFKPAPESTVINAAGVIESCRKYQELADELDFLQSSPNSGGSE